MDDEKVYICRKLPLRANLNYLRCNKLLFDFEIHIDNTIIPAHKVVLAASSDYFKAMLSHDTIEQENSKVILEDITVDAMNTVLDFIYTSKLKITVDNVQDVLLATSIFHMKEIRQLCVKFIDERISISNCIGVATLADRCSIDYLYDRCMDMCLDNFEKLVEEIEFTQIEEEWLIKLISHDQLNVCDEEKVIHAIEKWISADPIARGDRFDHLIRYVRFCDWKVSKLLELEQSELFKNSDSFQRLINEAKNQLLLMAYPDEERAEPNTSENNISIDLQIKLNFNTRLPAHKKQRIYAVGGWTTDSRPTATVERYNPFNNRWELIKSMSNRRCGAGAIVVNNSLYVIGGHDGQIYLRSVERYDIEKDCWFENVASMNCNRTSVGVVELDGHIYACGGQVGSQASNAFERFNIKKNTWKELCVLREQRLGPGVVVLDGIIYAIGGSVGSRSNSRVLSSVEFYDPKRGVWIETVPMNVARKHCGCTVFDGKIYAIGGRGNYDPSTGTDEAFDSAECFDPITRKWSIISPMKEKRGGVGVVQLNGLIYAAGGTKSGRKTPTNMVEAYDPKTETWARKADMIKARLGFGLAAHYKPVLELKSNVGIYPEIVDDTILM